MKRPILVITLGFITGILWGLYFNIVPFIFLGLTFLNLILKKIKFKNTNNYIKIFRIFLFNNIIIIFLISAFISSIYLINCNKKYEIIYNKFSKKEIIATVISNQKETEYKDIYKIKVEEYKNILLEIRQEMSELDLITIKK